MKTFVSGYFPAVYAGENGHLFTVGQAARNLHSLHSQSAPLRNPSSPCGPGRWCAHDVVVRARLSMQTEAHRVQDSWRRLRMLRGDAHSPWQTPSSEANIGGRCWADAHISDFQCLKPVVMPKYFSACLLERIYGMAREAERRGTCQTHGNDKHFKLYLQVRRAPAQACCLGHTLLESHTEFARTRPTHRRTAYAMNLTARSFQSYDERWKRRTASGGCCRARPSP